MGYQTYMQKRPTGYYFRKAVPLDLVESIGRREVVESLKTKDYSEAKRLDTIKAQEWDNKFSEYRKVKLLPAAVRLEYLEKLQSLGLIDKTATELTFELVQAIRAKLMIALKKNAARPAEKVYEIRESVKVPINFKGDIADLPKNSKTIFYDDDSYPKTFNIDLVGDFAVVEEMLATFNGEESNSEFPYVDYLVKGAAIALGDDKNEHKGIKLSEMHQRWERERNAGAMAKVEWDIAVRRFIELNGDLPVNKISKAHIRDYKDALAELPTRLPTEYKKTAFPKVLEAVRSGKCKGGELPAPATVNKMLNAISSILSLAVDNGYIENNPAHRVRLPENKGRQGEKRLSYSKEDLKLIFTSPIYTGRLNARQREIAGKMIIKDHKYWLPLIALYSGARLEEIGQSLITDIGCDNGVYYLDINTLDEGKSLKTTSSHRKVPLHKSLIDVGFIKYVESMQSKGEAKLFPELNKDKHGRCTRPFSKWYSRYTRELGITDKRKVFHSFRHAFKDACRHAEIEEAIHDALTGHTTASIGCRYGSGYNISVLNNAIQRIDYGIGKILNKP